MGDTFIKHPSSNTLAGLIGAAEGFSNQVDSLMKTLGSARNGSYMPSVGAVNVAVGEAKLFLASLHVSVTILKDVHRADSAKAKAGAKRECVQRVKSKVKITDMPQDLMSRLQAA